MRLKKPVALMFSSISLVIFGMTSSGIALAQTEVSAQAYRTVNVRSGPGTLYPVIGQLVAETSVPVTGRSDTENNWLQIDFEGQAGWVAFFTVVVSGDMDSLPVVEAAPPTVQVNLTALSLAEVASEEDVFVTSFRRVNVRSGPGTDFERLAVLAPGDMAPIIGRSEDNEWLQIDFEGQTGWVAFFVISVTGDLENVPVVDAAELSPEATETAEIEAAAVLALPAFTMTTRFNSNLRAEPSFTSEVLVVIPFDTTLEIEARTAENSWLRVTYEGQTGWLLASLASFGPEVDLESLPIDAGDQDS